MDILKKYSKYKPMVNPQNLLSTAEETKLYTLINKLKKLKTKMIFYTIMYIKLIFCPIRQVLPLLSQIFTLHSKQHLSPFHIHKERCLCCKYTYTLPQSPHGYSSFSSVLCFLRWIFSPGRVTKPLPHSSQMKGFTVVCFARICTWSMLRKLKPFWQYSHL